MKGRLNSDDDGRLRWRCRRGMRELDVILLAYLDSAFRELSAADKSRFAALLELPDPVLHAYLVGRSEPPDDDIARIIDGIRHSIHR